MYRFELHTPPNLIHPSGQVRTVRMVELDNSDLILMGLFDFNPETRIKTVDYYEKILHKEVVIGQPKGTQVFLICQSKANT